MSVLLYVTLATFKIVSVIFAILIMICLCVVLFGFTLFGTLFFLDLEICFLYQVRKVLVVIVANTFSMSFSLLLL